MKELTDNEIIKALECCSTGIFVCDTEACPLKDSVPDTIAACRFELVILALDLINRLQADKEALIAGQETLQKALAEKDKEIERLNNHIPDVTKMVKAEIKGVEGQWIILQVQS